MLEVVLDTQSAISGLLDFGAPREIMLLAYRRRIQLWGSNETYSEFCRVVRYPRLERRVLSRYLTIQSLEHEFFRIFGFCDTEGVEPGVLVEADRDDEEFIRVAIATDANYLVSRDKHLLNLGKYKSIPIVRPSAFMSMWRNRRDDEAGTPALWTRRRWRVWGKSGGT